MRTQLKWAKKSKSKYVRYRRRAVGAPLWICTLLSLCVKEEFPFERKIPPCPRAHMLIIFIKRQRQLNLSRLHTTAHLFTYVYVNSRSLCFHYAGANGGEEYPLCKADAWKNNHLNAATKSRYIQRLRGISSL